VERPSETTLGDLEKKEEAKATRPVDVVIPPFSFENFRHGMEILENLWLSNQNTEKMMVMEPTETRKTARAYTRPPVPLMDRELHRPRTSSPKVWRPKV
jgi:hypothetical protein